MVPAPTYQNLPTFGTGAALVEPIAGTYNGGFLPGQLFPAEYENWLMNYITANSNTSQTSVVNLVAEMGTILAAASITPVAGLTDQVYAALNALYETKIDAAFLAPKASPTFTGTVVVPVASGSTSPPQKTYVDSADAILQANIDSLSLQASKIDSRSTTGGSRTETVNTMTVGQVSSIGWALKNTTGVGINISFALPAVGTYQVSLMYNSSSVPGGLQTFTGSSIIYLTGDGIPGGSSNGFAVTIAASQNIFVNGSIKRTA